ncbi:MAG: nucleotidyltransferase domain-containing protein [Defluviitaleaceae bacterium]|nr:nucleotidyltransferase domain-containing protein [Defluviitaleaceae bacterium]
MIDKHNIDWQTLKLRPNTRKLLEIISQTTHEDYVKAIVLFGSEAHGKATLTSDVDLALISTRTLNQKERRSILKNISIDLDCKVDCRIVCLREEALNTGKKLHVGTSIKRDGVIIYENVS